MSDETEVLLDYLLQFGAFRGQTFRWIPENKLGYCCRACGQHAKRDSDRSSSQPKQGFF